MANNLWQIKRSILFELDTFFSLIYDYLPKASLSSSIHELLDSIPREMAEELKILLLSGHHYFNLLFLAGYSVRTEYEEDFASATLPIRQLDSKEYIRLTLLRLKESGVEIKVDSRQSLVEQMKMIQQETIKQSSQRLGFSSEAGEIQSLANMTDIEVLSRLLAGGELHDPFWHWLDRFYYQYYQPWRQLHLSEMEAQEDKARIALGASTHQVLVDWLPQVNPLRFSPQMIEALKNQILHVVFLVEPFKFPDAWFILPEGLSITFADNPESFQQFVDFVDHLSERLKALADPNRLMIMRIARKSGKDNTEIASFLNVSRPTVSIHAKQLREAGLIETFEEGRSVRHEVRAAEVRELFNDLERFLDLP
jgi:DNA-binding transcriptional ArsR family regulator